VGSIDFEGRRVAIQEGDSIASALYRAGVRTFSRSLKYHRRRGLYCLSGDCPNCILTVDDEPGVRSCRTDAAEGQTVRSESGWPSTEHDLLSVTDKAHRLMPVGFYYKTFIKPRFAWELAERVIRRATGVGSLPTARPPEISPQRWVHADLLVIGAGIAGLSAAKEAAVRVGRVIVVDEGRVAETISSEPLRRKVLSLSDELRATEGVEILERHVAVGIYEGPSVAVVGPDALLEIEPASIVVATGAVETHPVFPGNDLPGVWLGRGAARMAGVHDVAPGDRAVVVVSTLEGIEHLVSLRACGMQIAAVVAPDEFRGSLPSGLPVVRGGRVLAASGKKHLSSVLLDTPWGKRRIDCDVLVCSVGYDPRDGLLRMSDGPPILGAGDVIAPGCSAHEAAASGAAAARGIEAGSRPAAPTPLGRDGFVCICEDVSVHDLEKAWGEGWRSSEILKRYTTATMGPCQGALCGTHLAAFAQARAGGAAAGARTTSRPPARTVRLEQLAGGVDEVIEKRTSLHDAHLSAGATLDWSGSWKRPYRYGDVAGEIRAVRERVSVMDVGTLGKFLVAGADARELVDRIFPCRIDDLAPGRSRYLLALDEAGYVMDDGLVCALENGRYYLTSTSGGADGMEAWLRNWADRFDLRAHVVNQTAMLGAINVAGPRARELLARLSDDDIGAERLGPSALADITVAGIACRALRAGFVGELSYELHHPRSRSEELWNALVGAGADLGIRPHGLDALDVLRMEKGHVYLGQDTLPDDHPSKLGLGWCVAMDKPAFLGKVALERMAAIPLERKLVGLRFDAGPQRGAPLHAGDEIVGRITSCARSESLGQWIGLGWIRAVAGEFPGTVRSGAATASVVARPFYDPEGARLRA
jgi:sarcosine oxidase, subunit alpha